MSPFVYDTAKLVEEWCGLEAAAKKFGLLEQPSFNTAVPADALPEQLQKVLTGLKIDVLTTPWKNAREDNLVPFGPQGVAVESEEAPSGIGMVGHIPRIWLHTIDGYINGVDLLREVGYIVEFMHTDWMRKRLPGGVFKSEPFALGHRTVTLTRESAVAFHLERVGYKMRDATRLDVNGHAAALQAISTAMLLGLDVRWVLLDVLFRAKVDHKMHHLAETLARRGGVDWADRAELDDYTRTNFKLYYGPEDAFYPNVQEISMLACYFARHVALNARHAAIGVI